jgi:nitrogen fixation/metabolism regulation signal transduction histidine kinase
MLGKTPPAEMFGARHDELVLSVGTGSIITKYFLICTFIAFSINEIICVLLIWMILYKLKNSAGQYSKNTLRLHFQLTILLAVQLLIPLIFIVYPMFLSIYIYSTGAQLSELQIKSCFILLELYCPFNSGNFYINFT